jgi:CRP/FNR family transcriptional regulator
MNELISTPAVCTKCERCVVHHHGLCNAVPAEALPELNRISHLRRYPKDSVIIGQGDDAPFVGNVVEGIVTVSNMFVNGREQIVGLMFPSDFFGQVYERRSRFFYKSATDSIVCVINRSDFERFIEKYPETGRHLLACAFREIDSLREWISLLASQTALQRVATFLHMLACRVPNQYCLDRETVDNVVVTLPVTRRDIAAYIGTTPETLSRNMQIMIRRNVIRQINTTQYELLNQAALLKIAGEAGKERDEGRWLPALP